MATNKISLMVMASKDVASLLTDTDARRAFLDKIQAVGIDGVEILFGGEDG